MHVNPKSWLKDPLWRCSRSVFECNWFHVLERHVLPMERIEANLCVQSPVHGDCPAKNVLFYATFISCKTNLSDVRFFLFFFYQRTASYMQRGHRNSDVVQANKAFVCKTFRPIPRFDVSVTSSEISGERWTYPRLWFHLSIQRCRLQAAKVAPIKALA